MNKYIFAELDKRYAAYANSESQCRTRSTMDPSLESYRANLHPSKTSKGLDRKLKACAVTRIRTFTESTKITFT